jgi:signal transduction histidine kinase/Tfp pilus assembly protein PilF
MYKITGKQVKKILPFVLIFMSFRSPLPDTTYLKSLYDHCLDFDESKRDSLPFYIDYIAKNSKLISFEKGDVLTLRLRGLNEELHSDYSKALEFYLLSLEAARKLEEKVYETTALSDIAIIYSLIQQPVMAKKYYLQCAQLAEQTNEIYSLGTSYNNLGIIYNQLGDHDSALVFLNKALSVYSDNGIVIDHSNTLNNIGNAYFKKGEFSRALTYFQQNYIKHVAANEPEAVEWVDHLNLADTYIELKQYQQASIHADSSLLIAQNLKADSKISDSYSILAKLYARQNKFEKAYGYMTKWYQLDTALINGSTQNTIAELQERFNLKEREAENELLMTQIEKERYKSRSAIILSIALGVTGLFIALALAIKRNANKKLQKKNDLIVRQNERLEELNFEKNSLIGIVSHDLSTPFATIKMWSQVLEAQPEKNNEEQVKAIDRILKASEHGQKLIQRILDVEKADIGTHHLQLEAIDVTKLIAGVIDNLSLSAEKKQQQIIFNHQNETVSILTDKQLLHRVFENLLSNSIKYSSEGKRIWIKLVDETESISVHFEDEGVGIPADEIPYLFTKYSKISSKPTAGEMSTGLGLSIVKRIAEELNGKLRCTSQEGIGTTFTVQLPK